MLVKFPDGGIKAGEACICVFSNRANTRSNDIRQHDSEAWTRWVLGHDGKRSLFIGLCQVAKTNRL